MLDLKSFLFLLTASSLVSGRRLLNVEEDQRQNSTVSNYTQQYNNETALHFTVGPVQTTEIREEQSSAAPTLSQETTSSKPQGNGTSESLYNVEGTETNSTKHQLAGNESLAGTESPSQTSFPEKKGSSDPTATASANTLSASVGPRNVSNATNPVLIAVTTAHMDTNGSSRLKSTAVPSATEIRTAPDHVPTKPHSTRYPDKSSTKVCPIAETKKESVVSRCLIAIAGLATLAIVFIMTTIVLATKLAGSKYRHRKSLFLETEMVCISALMNDSDHPIPTPKRPKSNGALIPIIEDDGDGDDLTLNSFLHDTEAVA